MLVIRMQRTGRKGHAQFRVVVQDSRRTPSSGKIVASLGHYDPHSKQTSLDKEKAKFYLDHGAQPSDRVARLLKSEGVKLPSWVKLDATKERAIRNPEKLRRNRPAEPVVEKPVEEAEAPNAEEATMEAPAEEVATESDAVVEAAEPTEETATSEAAAVETETPAEAPSESETVDESSAEEAEPEKPTEA